MAFHVFTATVTVDTRSRRMYVTKGVAMDGCSLVQQRYDTKAGDQGDELVSEDVAVWLEGCLDSVLAQRTFDFD